MGIAEINALRTYKMSLHVKFQKACRLHNENLKELVLGRMHAVDAKIQEHLREMRETPDV